MITLVNQKNQQTAAGGSTTKAITITAPTAGNTLTVQIGDIAAAPTQIVSVSQGATAFTKQASEYGTTNDLETWVLPNCGTGTTINVVVSLTYGQQPDCLIAEWSGMPTTTALDGSAGNNGSGSTITTSTITPTFSGAVLVLAQAISVSHGISTPGNGFTEFSDQSGTANRAAFAYKIINPGASVQCSWTKDASYGVADMLIAAFDGSGGTNYSQSLADSLTLSDGNITKRATFPTATDSLTLSAVISAIRQTFPSLSDTLTLSSSITASRGAILTLSDSLILSAVASAVKGTSPSLSDSLTLSTIIAAGRATFPTLSDTLTLSAAASALVGMLYSESLSDSLTLSDAASAASATLIFPILDQHAVSHNRHRRNWNILTQYFNRLNP